MTHGRPNKYQQLQTQHHQPITEPSYTTPNRSSMARNLGPQGGSGSSTRTKPQYHHEKAPLTLTSTYNTPTTNKASQGVNKTPTNNAAIATPLSSSSSSSSSLATASSILREGETETRRATVTGNSIQQTKRQPTNRGTTTITTNNCHPTVNSTNNTKNSKTDSTYSNTFNEEDLSEDDGDYFKFACDAAQKRKRKGKPSYGGAKSVANKSQLSSVQNSINNHKSNNRKNGKSY